jgi:hypothetical protein
MFTWSMLNEVGTPYHRMQRNMAIGSEFSVGDGFFCEYFGGGDEGSEGALWVADLESFCKMGSVDVRDEGGSHISFCVMLDTRSEQQ